MGARVLLDGTQRRRRSKWLGDALYTRADIADELLAAFKSAVGIINQIAATNAEERRLWGDAPERDEWRELIANAEGK